MTTLLLVAVPKLVPLATAGPVRLMITAGA